MVSDCRTCPPQHISCSNDAASPIHFISRQHSETPYPLPHAVSTPLTSPPLPPSAAVQPFASPQLLSSIQHWVTTTTDPSTPTSANIPPLFRHSLALPQPRPPHDAFFSPAPRFHLRPHRRLLRGDRARHGIFVDAVFSMRPTAGSPPCYGCEGGDERSQAHSCPTVEIGWRWTRRAPGGPHFSYRLKF